MNFLITFRGADSQGYDDAMAEAPDLSTLIERIKDWHIPEVRQTFYITFYRQLRDWAELQSDKYQLSYEIKEDK